MCTIFTAMVDLLLSTRWQLPPGLRGLRPHFRQALCPVHARGQGPIPQPQGALGARRSEALSGGTSGIVNGKYCTGNLGCPLGVRKGQDALPTCSGFLCWGDGTGEGHCWWLIAAVSSQWPELLLSSLSGQHCSDSLPPLRGLARSSRPRPRNRV